MLTLEEEAQVVVGLTELGCAPGEAGEAAGDEALRSTLCSEGESVAAAAAVAVVVAAAAGGGDVEGDA